MDWKQISDIALLRGIKLKTLADLVGINAGHLRRLRCGQHAVNLELLNRAVEILQIEPSAAADLPDGWTQFSKNDQNLTKMYNSELGRARRVLTISRSIDSYLQDEDMLEWSNRIWTGSPDWEAFKVKFLPYAKEQVAARSHGDFVHRIVCPWKMFETARAMIPTTSSRRDRLLAMLPFEYSWLDRIRDGFGRYEEVCAVTPVIDFGSMYAEIESRLPTRCQKWTKACIIDNTRIVVHVDESFYLSSYCSSIVKKLQGEIEAIVKKYEPSFLLTRSTSLLKIRECNHVTNCRIEDLLISQQEYHSSYAFAVAFNHMLEENDFRTPGSYRHIIAPRR